MSDREIYDFICYQSYMLLTDDAKKILRYIAQSQAPVSWEELEMAAEITLDGQEKAAPAIRQLVRLSLVTPEGGHTKRYGVHPLTRTFVMNRLPGIKK